MSRGTELILNGAALRHNLSRVRELAPQSKILSVIKANAYGHGAIWAAKQLSALTDGFAVALLEEAVELRKAGIEKDILILEGVFDADELEQAQQLNCQLVIHHELQIEMLERSDKDIGILWLKVNTGMHRLGFPPVQVADVWNRLSALNSVTEIKLMTHFACSDDFSHTLNQQQLTNFQSITKNYSAQTSAANSAAIFNLPQSLGDWVRPGIMLYGSSPCENKSPEDCLLQPVMTLKAKVITLQEVAQGHSVGYGAEWVANRNSLIAVVSIGYGDGYPCQAPAGGPAAPGSCPSFQRLPTRH